MIIGITGRSGAGKSYASEILAKKLNLIHLDIDKISHEVLSFPETIKFIRSEFGESVFESGELQRKKLGKIVFGNHDKLKILNDFCQIQIEKRIDEIIKTSNKSIILDYALLCKLKQFRDCQITILLTADFETRFSRVAKREKISKEYFLSRDNSIEEFEKLKFDYIFNNITNDEIEELSSILQAKKENL